MMTGEPATPREIVDTELLGIGAPDRVEGTA
jgi:hypothetical protein